jgi:hypothetical protein
VCRGWGVACWGNYWESGHLRICCGKAQCFFTGRRPVTKQCRELIGRGLMLF